LSPFSYPYTTTINYYSYVDLNPLPSLCDYIHGGTSLSLSIQSCINSFRLHLLSYFPACPPPIFPFYLPVFLSLICPQFVFCSAYFFLCFSLFFYFVPFYFRVTFELRLQVFFVSLYLVHKTCRVYRCTVPVCKATCATLLLMLTAVYPCVTSASSA